MGVFKQFIYTNTQSALGVWGQSAAFPPNIMQYKDKFYVSYDKDAIKFQNIDDIDFDEIFPVKRKYSVSGGKCIFLKVSYLGQGLHDTRMGNRFAHLLTTDGAPVNEPLSYFLREDFFRNGLNDEEKKQSKSLKYLDDIEDNAYFCAEISDNVSKFIDSAEKTEALAALLERALYVAQSETAHMVFVNCGNGKLLWNWLQSIVGLLPYELSEKCTFDTFFKFNRSVEWFRMRDKFIGFYANEKFDLCKERGHEYFVYDLSLPCSGFAGEASEKFKAFAAKIFGAESGVAALKIYRYFINKTQGADAFEKMQKCAELSFETALKFGNFPIEAVCSALSAGIYGDITDVLPALREVVSFACGCGVDELRAVLKTFNAYQPLKDKLKQVTEEEVTKEAFVKTAAERVLSNDKIILNFISELERYLKPSDKFEKALSDKINDLIRTEAAELAYGLLNGNADSVRRFEFIGSYSPETQITIRKNIDKIFVSDGESITERALESGDGTVLKSALTFGFNIEDAVRKFVGAYVKKHLDAIADGLVNGNLQAENTFIAAKEIYPETARLVAVKTDEIFEREKEKLAKEIAVGETAEASVKLAAFEKYGGSTDVNAFLPAVSKKLFSGAEDWNGILEKDGAKLAALKYLAGNSSAKEFLVKSFVSFLTSEEFENGKITVDGALEILCGCGFEAIADKETVFNGVIASETAVNACALGFVTGYIKDMPDNKHRDFCVSDKKRYATLFNAAASVAVTENSEADNLFEVCGIFKYMGGKAQANMLAKYVESGRLSKEKYSELLIKILSGENYAETLAYFLRKNAKTAEYYIELYLKRILTECAVTAVLSVCGEDISAVAQLCAEMIWKSLSGKGTASAAETFNGMVAFFKTASTALKQYLLKEFILSYGVKFFTAAEVKRLCAVCTDCKGGYFAAVCAYGELVQGNVVADREVLVCLENKNVKVWTVFRTAIADLIAEGKLNPKCFGCVIGIFGKELANSVLGRFGRYTWGKLSEKNVLGFLESFKKGNGIECLHGYALSFVENKNILDYLRINCGKTDAQKELNRFTEYLTYSGKDDAEHLNAFCGYIKAVSVCDDGLAQAVIYNLGLRDISLKNLTRLIDGLESVQFDAVKYLFHLRTLRCVLGGKPVSVSGYGKEGEKPDERLNGYFARIFAHMTVCGSVNLQTAETLYSLYGDLYAEAFAEELTCASRAVLKIKGLSKTYDMLCGKFALIKQKTDNFIKYAEADEKFRVQSESIFAGN